MDGRLMKRRAVVAAGALVLAAGGLVAAGCGSDEAATTATATTEQVTTGGTSTALDVTEIAVGEDEAVRLEVNEGTGYQWRAAGGSALDDGLVTLSDTDYEGPETETNGDDEPMVGQAGVQVFVYEGAKAGEGQLQYELVAPGTEEVTETRVVTVKVTG